MSMGLYERGNGNGGGTSLVPRDPAGDIVLADGEILEHSSPSSLSIATRSEIESQVATAKRYPRSIKKFADDALAMATLTPEIARSCVYSVPRGGKNITGPSVRLAEIIAACYGNLRVAVRIVDEDTRFITAEAVCLDVERNSGVTSQVRRRITDKNGRTFNDDMIGVTGAAASAIARRNAIFAVVPNAFTQMIYGEAVKVAAGKGKAFADQRDEWLESFTSIGISAERIFRALGVNGRDDMTAAHIETLIGIESSVQAKETTYDDAFPKPLADLGQPEPGQTKSSRLASDLKARKEKAEPDISATEGGRSG